MSAVNISIGRQDFEKFRINGSFYVDKTRFIQEWWEKDDDVTLITRPRRFGKTLNMSMLECFFSTEYAGRGDLFEGLAIWKDEKYRRLQGTYPVLNVSFAEIKGRTFGDTREGLLAVLRELYGKHRYLLQGDSLSEDEKKNYYNLGQHLDDGADPAREISDTTIARALKTLMIYMARYYGKKVILLLDEYDTPLQEAYIYGYWEQLAGLMRSICNSTCKTNEYLYRALLTGITRVSKESIFSDLNNLMIVTTTSDEYSTAFGFTQQEVYAALWQNGLVGEEEEVRAWYDGFCFGNTTDIYNPWSITMFIRTREFGTYWADTSSNRLISDLLREGSPELKMQLEALLEGKDLPVNLDEQVIFEQLKNTKGAIWSLLVASGYLKPVSRQLNRENGEYTYRLRITNHETMLMFRKMISGWFPEDITSYGDLKKALVQGDVKHMNRFMNEVAKEMFGFFGSAAGL